MPNVRCVFQQDQNPFGDLNTQEEDQALKIENQGE